MKRHDHILLALTAAAVVLALGGCQAIFTYSPVSGLQRSPSSLTPAERVTYAENALASGNTDTMKTAYNAIKNDTGDTAQYLAAQLGFEASGVPGLVLEAVTQYTSGGTSAILSGGATSITDFLAANPSVDPQYLIDAAANLQNVSSVTSISSMDYVYGGLGLALAAAQQPDGSFNFAAAPAADLTAAAAFVAAGAAGMSPTDPVATMLTEFSSYIAGL